MADFFVLECLPPIGFEHYNIEVPYPANSLRWESGLLFSNTEWRDNLHPPKNIIEMQTNKGYDDMPSSYAELYWVPIPLMSRRLVTALHAAGVDNLQTYETQLLTTQGNNPPPQNNYLAVNIIGLVAATDLNKAMPNPEVKEKLISMDFYSLSIDENKARGLLMFRLAENISAVIVHERVKNIVESKGITTLNWLEPEKWAG
jgi:hypothetical protein